MGSCVSTFVWPLHCTIVPLATPAPPSHTQHHPPPYGTALVGSLYHPTKLFPTAVRRGVLALVEELPAGFIAEHRSSRHRIVPVALTEIAGTKRRLRTDSYERPVSRGRRAIAFNLHLAGNAHRER